jgi:hypothetical protein
MHLIAVSDRICSVDTTMVISVSPAAISIVQGRTFRLSKNPNRLKWIVVLYDTAMIAALLISLDEVLI